MMISSKPLRLIASWTAATGSESPMIPSTWLPADSLSLGSASSRTPWASSGPLVLGVHDPVQPVCRVWDEQREGARPLLGAGPDGVQKWLRRGGLVGYDEHPRGL